MAVNYNDSRFQQVNAEKQNALNNVNNMYNNMINDSNKYYQDQIDAANKYAETQKELQQQNTDFAIEQINQQKDFAKKDYTKEQKASYVDWQKQSNRYGANAEAMASQGMTNTGYSESSQVSMYNTYQNRVATARDTYNRAVLQYDNSIKEAQLANNSKLAEIAYNGLKTQLELSLQGFQYRNTLLQQQLQAQNETEDRYYNRWKDVLNQINTENALAEQQRQFNIQMAYQRSSGGGGYGIGDSASIDKSGNITTAFYSGAINPDAKHGTFSNGYQPNNVNGKKLTSTGKTIKITSRTLQGTQVVTTQTIWKTSNGTKYIWDGTRNKYVKFTGK